MAKDGKKHHRLIQSYGLFWVRDEVAWRRGKLLGVANNDSKQGEVDFSGQLGIYALYDPEFRLLYVGQVGSGENTLFDRLKQHHTLPGNRAFARRWQYFSWFGVLRVLKGKATLAMRPAVRQTTLARTLDALEAVAIEIADPDLNRQGGKLGDVTEYLQVCGSKNAKEEA